MCVCVCVESEAMNCTGRIAFYIHIEEIPQNSVLLSKSLFVVRSSKQQVYKGATRAPCKCRKHSAPRQSFCEISVC